VLALYNVFQFLNRVDLDFYTNFCPSIFHRFSFPRALPLFYTLTDMADLADTIIKTMLVVFPPLIVVVKQHTVNGRAKKAQELVDKSRALMKEHWRKMSKEQREELRSQLDILAACPNVAFSDFTVRVTDLQSRLDGQRQVPRSLDPKNISNSRVLKEAANVLWNVAVVSNLA
jgi:hypothetical protein